jgi:hypothetical protein
VGTYKLSGYGIFEKDLRPAIRIKIAINNKTALYWRFSFLEPPVGIEPTTY